MKTNISQDAKSMEHLIENPFAPNIQNSKKKKLGAIKR